MTVGKMLYVLLAAAIVVSTVADCIAFEEKGKVDAIVLSVNGCLADYGFRHRVALQHPLPFFEKDGLTLAGRPTDPIELTFDSEGGVVQYFDNVAFNKAFGDGAQMFKKTPPPGWGKDKAMKIASDFVSKVLEVDVGALKLWGAEYSAANVRSRAGKYVGKWRVIWRRVTRSGIPYANDDITVLILEGAGPYALKVNFSTKLAADTAKLKSEQAVKIAASHRAKFIAWRSSEGFPAIVACSEHPSSTEKYVLVPNRLTDRGGFHEAAMKMGNEGRFAWIVKYGGRSELSKDGEYDFEVQIWIDATDGSLLGGDLSQLAVPASSGKGVR